MDAENAKCGSATNSVAEQGHIGRKLSHVAHCFTRGRWVLAGDDIAARAVRLVSGGDAVFRSSADRRVASLPRAEQCAKRGCEYLRASLHLPSRTEDRLRERPLHAPAPWRPG